MKFPPELAAKWSKILDAAFEIGGWASGYSQGYIDSDEQTDFPKEPPTDVPLWQRKFGHYGTNVEGVEWKDWPHKDMYVEMRELGDTGSGPRGREYPEFNFGTFKVFRVTLEEHRQLLEGYEDTAGTENERFIEDGDHMIVVYMS